MKAHMKTAIVYDVETTGLPLFNEPSEDPRQPHLVQLAACLVDLYSRKVVSTIDVTIRPEGWTIPDEVAAIHGITTEVATVTGVPEDDAVRMFMRLWAKVDFRVAHNEQFDARLIRIALKRYQGDEQADHWKSGKAQCTQALSTPILKLPPTPKMVAAGFKKHKSDNLGEAYQFFTGKPIEGAHNALDDVRACMAVYWAIQDRQRQAVAA